MDRDDGPASGTPRGRVATRGVDAAHPRPASAQTDIASPHPPFDRVVVPVGGSAAELEAQRAAVEYAATHGLPVRAIHVAESPAIPPMDLFGYLESLCERHGTKLTTRVREGTVVDALARELGVRDLVVVGADLHGASGGVPSVVAGLMRQAPCAVQVVPLGWPVGPARDPGGPTGRC